MPAILFATLDYPPDRGGAAAYLDNLARALPKGSVTVLAPRAKTQIVQDPEFVVRKNVLLKFIWPKWLPLIYRIFRLAVVKKLDVIGAAQVLPVGTAAFIVSAILHIPYFVISHGMDVAILRNGSWKYRLARFVLTRAAFVIANSSYTHNLLHSFGVPNSKILTLLPCPNVTPEKFHISPERVKTLRNMHALEGRFVLLTVGRLVKRKGIDVVLNALRFLNVGEKGITYVIAGDGPERPALESLAHELSRFTHHRVLFTGAIDDEELSLWYSTSDLFILTPLKPVEGDVEGFGIVYVEANAFGRPVIGAKIGGVSDAIIHEETGLLVQPDDHRATAESILRLLRDQKLMINLGMNGKQRVDEQFQWSARAEELITFINKKSPPGDPRG